MEVRWVVSKDEYTREEVYYMLETQRAMIINDLKYLLMHQADAKGIKGKLTAEGHEIMSSLNDCRKVKF